MSETFTKPSNAIISNVPDQETDAKENLDADDLIFYHSLRADLDLLKKKPKLQTIHAILDHSKSLR